MERKKSTYAFICIVFVAAISLNAGWSDASAYTGMPTHSIRGATCYVSVAQEELLALKSWGANTVRLMLMVRDLVPYPYGELPTSRITSGNLARVKRIVEWANTLGIAVILDLHEIPGYVRFSAPQDLRIWDPIVGYRYKNLLMNVWYQLAIAFRNYPEYSIAYELLNEPEPRLSENEPENRGAEWDDLQYNLHRLIRRYDRRHTILISASYSWRLSSLMSWTPDARMIDGRTALSVHFYEPLDFTQQIEAFWGSAPPRTYPGWFGEAVYEGQPGLVFWDYWKMRERLQIAGDFQGRFPGLPLIMTEMSAMGVAPGAEVWLSDAINVMKELWIGWCYHSFRETAYLKPLTGMVESPWDLETGDPDRLATVKAGFENP